MSNYYVDDIKDAFTKIAAKLSTIVTGEVSLEVTEHFNGAYYNVEKTITDDERRASVTKQCFYCWHKPEWTPGKVPFRMYRKDIHERWCNYHPDKKKLSLSDFRIHPFNNNGRIAIVSDVDFLPPFVEITGVLLHKMRLDALKKAGCRLVLCTVNDSNQAELAIMSRFKWHAGDHFDDVTLFIKNLE